MNINRQNIELIFFEYFEGNLSQEEIKELFLFLDENPDLKKQFGSYLSIKLTPDTTIHFDKKDLLKKPVESDIDSFELLCIQFIENDLNADEKLELLNQISENQEKQKIFNDYQESVLKSENDIEYTYKESLKKSYSAFEERCIEYIEGQLNNTEIKELFFEVNKDQNEKATFELYKKTKLEPDHTLIYSKKENLKKSASTKIFSLRWAMSAAASVIVIIFVSLYLSKEDKLISNQIAAINHLNPVNNRNIQKQNKTIKFQKHFPVKYKKQNQVIQNVEPVIENNYAEENKQVKDSSINPQNVINTPEHYQYAQKNTSVGNDSVANEVLEKLFAQNKFNYFHEMIQDANTENQAYMPNHKGSWWNTLENGSKYIREYTGTNVVVKEQKYEGDQRVKQEITLGNFSFSRSFTKK